MPAPGPRPKQGSRWWQYLVVAAIVIGGGAIAGFQIRTILLDRQIETALVQAAQHSARDTYAGYVRAQSVYEAIAEVQPTVHTRAALARLQAIMAAEFGADADAAKTMVTALEGEPDAAKHGDLAIAAAFLALAAEDGARALELAKQAESLAPGTPYAPYIQGHAHLLANQGIAANAAFMSALGRQRRPLFQIGLAYAYRANGQLAEASLTFSELLKQYPNHPTAILGLADVALTGRVDTDMAKNILPDLEALIADTKRPLGEQKYGASPEQRDLALIRMGSLLFALGDRDKAEATSKLLSTVRSATIAKDLNTLQIQLDAVPAAMETAKRAFAQWPHRIDVRHILARTAILAGDLETAQSALDLSEIDEPDAGGKGASGSGKEAPSGPRAVATADTYVLRSQVYRQLGDIDTALLEADKALRLAPDSVEATRIRAEIDLSRGNARDAAKRLSQVAGIGAPLDVRLLYATALRESGDYEQARDVLTQLATRPDAGRVFIELARIERSRGRFDAARDAYVRAIERMPGNAEAALESIRLNFDTGARDQARREIRKLARRARKDVDVLSEAARIYTWAGLYDQAEDYLDTAIARNDGASSAPMREQGRLALRRGEFRDAVKALKRAQSRPDATPVTVLLYIKALLADGRSSTASRIADTIGPRFGANIPETFLAAGMVAAASGDHRTALDAYRNAQAILTERNAVPRRLSQVQELIGSLHFAEGQLREARSALEEAIRLDPQSAEAHLALARVEYENEEDDRTRELLEKALNLDERGVPDAWFYLGQVQFEAKRKRPAKKALRTYLRLRPKGPHAEAAQGYLRQLR